MKRKTVLFSILILLILSAPLYSKTKKSNEKRFQLGFGVTASTGNLLGLIENVRLMQSYNGGTAYDYPGLTAEQQTAINNLSLGMRKAVMVANILGSMEYGLQMRIKWHMLLAHTDLIFLPFDGSYNGRFDFMWTANIGIRAPFIIQPYLTVGPVFTFSWYPGSVTDIRDVEQWKSAWGTVGNFSFRPGLNTVVGLDIKLSKFSFGVYYKYTIKDFEEFGAWFTALTNDLVESNTANAQAKAAGMIFGAQSRFGVALTFYLF